MCYLLEQHFLVFLYASTFYEETALSHPDAELVGETDGHFKLLTHCRSLVGSLETQFTISIKMITYLLAKSGISKVIIKTI